MTRLTYGAEHEWADFPLAKALPEGYGRDIKDYTVVNSNGIANDPSGRLYGFGGEINTPPTQTPDGQVECLWRLKELFPEAKVNYRSNLHIHIRWPGLKDNLELLLRVQQYIHEVMPLLLPIIEPIPRPVLSAMFKSEGDVEGAFEGALRRYRRRLVSHHTLLPEKRLRRQLMATSINEFFALEVPLSGDKPMWHLQPRLCVNLRQLIQTDTVEFRHFPGTLSDAQLQTCVNWCLLFLSSAIDKAPVQGLMDWAQKKQPLFPRFPKYVHWMENRYRATCHDGTVPREKIAANIKAIKAGTFDSYGAVR